MIAGVFQLLPEINHFVELVIAVALLVLWIVAAGAAARDPARSTGSR